MWYYSDHMGTDKRVWQEGWPNDMFEVVDQATFDTLVRLMGMKLVPAE